MNPEAAYLVRTDVALDEGRRGAQGIEGFPIVRHQDGDSRARNVEIDAYADIGRGPSVARDVHRRLLEGEDKADAILLAPAQQTRQALNEGEQLLASGLSRGKARGETRAAPKFHSASSARSGFS